MSQMYVRGSSDSDDSDSDDKKKISYDRSIKKLAALEGQIIPRSDDLVEKRLQSLYKKQNLQLFDPGTLQKSRPR